MATLTQTQAHLENILTVLVQQQGWQVAEADITQAASQAIDHLIALDWITRDLATRTAERAKVVA